MSAVGASGGNRVHISLTPEQAREFVQALAEDDEFRDRLSEQPLETLADYGIQIPQEMIPSEIVLPSKDEAREALNSIDQGQELRLQPTGFLLSFLAWPFLILLGEGGEPAGGGGTDRTGVIKG